MPHYFGFVPSTKLATMIDEYDELLAGDPAEYSLYPHRDAVTKQIASEIIDNLLVSLIDVIPNPERKAKMQNIVGTIQSSTDTMLGVILGKDKNKDILPSVDYLKKDTMFTDDEGQTRIGFQLSPDKAQTIIEGFEAVTPDNVDDKKFKQSLETMNHAVLHHFIGEFTDTLPLGFIKRKSVPLAQAGIKKGLDMATGKLFPQLPIDAKNRLANFYRPFIVEV